VQALEEYVAGETLALEVSYVGEAARAAEVIDGRELRIGVAKV
jgi:hypothetical protein